MSNQDAIAAAAAIVHIQQLAINYAVGVDQRDIDLVAEQFVPDVACGHWGVGRDALKRMYHENDATMDLSIHRVSNHKVDILDDDHATGVVYLTADHRQHDGTWAYMVGAYPQGATITALDARMRQGFATLVDDGLVLEPDESIADETVAFAYMFSMNFANKTWHKVA